MLSFVSLTPLFIFLWPSVVVRGEGEVEMCEFVRLRGNKKC
jgi:hypothetical protein